MMDSSGNNTDLSNKPKNVSSFPLTEYAKKLEPRIKERCLEKHSAIGIDPVLLERKHFEPDWLPLQC